MVTSRKVINRWLFFVAKTNTAIAVSSVIKEVIQKQAQATRLTQKEVVYLGMLAIDALDKESRQELADKVHQMQVNGEIWGDKADRSFHVSTINRFVSSCQDALKHFASQIKAQLKGAKI